MNPMVFLVVFALGIISTASDPIHIERRTSDLDDAYTCLAEGYLKVKDDLDGMGGHAETDDDKLKCACDFFEVSFNSKIILLFRSSRASRFMSLSSRSAQ